MRTIDRSRPHTLKATKTRPRAWRDDHPFTRRLRPQLIADGVVAGYIHELSTRHRNGDDSEVKAYEIAPEAEAA